MRDEELRSLQAGVNAQLLELDGTNQQLLKEVQELKTENNELRKQVPEKGIDPRDKVFAELQEEIAELREKIAQKEQLSRKQRKEVERATVESDEAKQEAKELLNELRKWEAQLADTKGASTKKMAQKDETITFMQTEMMRLMKERHDVDQALREERNKVVDLEKQLQEEKTKAPQEVQRQRAPSPLFDEHAQMLLVSGFNEQIRELDESNKELEEQLKNDEYESGLKLKNKDSKILELETELTDLRWELNARKEADFVSLLKDRKDRKKELEVTKKSLKQAECRCADLERELEELKTHQVDLEKDAEELKNSLVSRDSGDYVSGLKRQVKSLKEHNKTLERNAEVLIADTAEALGKKQEQISQLELEMEDLKNPTKAAVRGLFAFGKKSEFDANASTHSVNYSAHGKNLSSHGANYSAHGKPTQGGKDAGSGESQETDTPTRASGTENAGVDPNPSQSAGSEPKKRSMKSLWSALASPLTPKSLRGFTVGDRTDKSQMKEAPIYEKDENDEEDNRNGEVVNAGPREDELSLEDELKAIENEIQVPSPDRDSSRDDEQGEIHSEEEKVTETEYADVSGNEEKEAIAEILGCQAEDEQIESNSGKSPADESALGEDDDDGAMHQNANVEDDDSGGPVAPVDSVELAQPDSDADQNSVGTGDSATASQDGSYSREELDADDSKDSWEGGSVDSYESDNANSLDEGEADDRSDDLQNSASAASHRDEDDSESWDDQDTRSDLGSETDEGETLENGDADSDGSRKKEGNVVFV